MENTNRNKVLLLWSGGWDGTFRLLQLARQDIQIQPIYLEHAGRGGRENEKAAMKSILEQIKKDKSFIADILDIVYYDVEWVLENCRDRRISEAYQYLHREYHVGSQYEWFALLCKKLGVQMESAVVHQYHGKVEDAIDAEGVLVPVENDFLEERYRVLPQGEKQSAFLLFGDLILPVIKLTKKDEERIARENGWIDIMKLTWFCHTPIKGQPCGLCGPCDDAMNTGMEWRMPRQSQIRYRYRFFFRCIRKVKKMIHKIISKLKRKQTIMPGGK